jgi:hypothetical protein
MSVTSRLYSGRYCGQIIKSNRRPCEEMKMDYCVGGGGQALRVDLVSAEELEILVRAAGGGDGESG